MSRPRQALLACAGGAVMVGAAVAAYLRRLEPAIRRWGATDDELDQELAADELVEPGVTRTTRAITVLAPIDEVWPWLAQLGQDRAGFYSYTWLENLVGAGMHNASSLHPEWQRRAEGDSVWLADQRRFHDRGRQVAALVDPPRALALVSPADWERLQQGQRASGAWSFELQERGAHATRLLVRSSGGAVGTHVFDALHFVMEQKMMRGLRDRAETHLAA